VGARVAAYLRGTAFRRGVLGSSQGWFALWAGLGLARWLKRRLGREAVVVERIVLHPGDAIEIRDTGIARESLVE
jgi:hypothetical protein